MQVERSNPLAQVTKAHQRPDAPPHRQPVRVDAATRSLAAAWRIVGQLDRFARRASVPKLLELLPEILLQRGGNRSPLHPHTRGRHFSASEKTYLSKGMCQVRPAGEGARSQRGRPRGVQNRKLLGREPDFGQVIGLAVNDVAVLSIVVALNVSNWNS